uniref:Uncharacterized protein n=1 Tax=Neolamprologus brichardi TaxID=32507 RepID=A0A3Q4H4B5_NEOBR
QTHTCMDETQTQQNSGMLQCQSYLCRCLLSMFLLLSGSSPCLFFCLCIVSRSSPPTRSFRCLFVHRPTQCCIERCCIERCCIERCCIERCCIERCCIERCCIEQCCIEQCCIEQCCIERCCIEQCCIEQCCIERCCYTAEPRLYHCCCLFPREQRLFTLCWASSFRCHSEQCHLVVS